MSEDDPRARIEPLEDGTMPRIAASAYIHPSAVVIGDVELGEDCSVWPNAVLRGDEGRIVFGPRCNIQDGVTVHMSGGVSDTIVGERVTVGHNCILHGCTIGDGALIGMGAILLDNAKIGAESLIGAGALVTGSTEIPPRSLVLGSPAKVKRELTAEELAGNEYSWRHYMEQAQAYRRRDGLG